MGESPHGDRCALSSYCRIAVNCIATAINFHSHDMLSIPNTAPHRDTSPRHLNTLALACCAASLVAAALLPVWAQTPANTDKAQERSQQQSDNVYRWIRYFADQPKKVDPNKTRPKVETPQLVKKPDAKAPAAPAQTDPVADTVVSPSVALPVADAQKQPPPPVVAAVAPVAPEAEVVSEVARPLRPINVVEPSIPRELRNETIKATVLLSFTVQQDGSVTDQKVVSGSNRRLNRTAMEAIAQWRFEPIQTARSTQIEFEFRQE